MQCGVKFFKSVRVLLRDSLFPDVSYTFIFGYPLSGFHQTSVCEESPCFNKFA